MLNVALLILGCGLYLLIMWDVLKTTLSLHGGGPVSVLITRTLDRVIAHVAPLRRYSMLVFTVSLFGVWLTALLVANTLILSTDASAVQQVSESNDGALWLNNLYFVGAALTTAGFGDFVPNGVLWQAITMLMALSGLIVTSLGISYVISLVGAVVSQRQLARRISNLGASPRRVLAAHYHEGSFARFGTHCTSIADALLLHTQRHLAYPVVHYIRATDNRSSLPTAIANLDEVLTVLLFEVPADAQPDLHQLIALREAITAYLESFKGIFKRDSHEQPPWPATEWLREKWHMAPVRRAEHLPDAHRKALAERRSVLRAAVRSQGHEWHQLEDLLSTGGDDPIDAPLLDLFAEAAA